MMRSVTPEAEGWNRELRSHLLALHAFLLALTRPLGSFLFYYPARRRCSV